MATSQISVSGAYSPLKRALKNDEKLNVEFISVPPDRKRLAGEDTSHIDLLFGHMPDDVHEEVGYGDDPRYLCFMRHPIARTISHYYHLRNVDKNPVGDKIRESKNIDDFFLNYQHWEFKNFMTGMISGFGKKAVGREQEAFEIAKGNLDKNFDFVGFHKYFSFSMRKLSTYLGIEL